MKGGVEGRDRVPQGAAPETERTVLLVDDDPAVRAALARDLSRPGVRTVEAADGSAALAVLAREPVHLVIADQHMPPPCGLELLERVRRDWPGVNRVLVSGSDDPRLAREAVNRAGVAYLLPKPWEPDAVEHVLRAIAPARTAGAARARERGCRFPDIVGESRAMQELLELVLKVAETDSTALVTGETGTGKELVGRAIHQASRRHHRVFCAVNSAAFPETLLESELFGHRRGAFTGASSNAKGLFEHADKGTVFLDEVAEMPLSMQAKLLRFLQTGEIRPVGGEAVRYVDVRLVTATNKELESEVAAGRFREDLYYRLAVIPVHVPPLRERLSDVPLLARHFLARMAEKSDKPVRDIDAEALDVLARHDWPGNVRELQNVIERGVALCRGDRITPADLPRRLWDRREGDAAGSVESLPWVERRHILETLDKVAWNRRRAAELLQISTTTLWRRLKEFGIEGDPQRRRRNEGRLPFGG